MSRGHADDKDALGARKPLRVALVGPVATTIPAPKSGSVEQITALLADGLSARGHRVTLFGVAGAQTSAALHATFERGYIDDPQSMWPWEMGELFNVAAACERHNDFDLIHYQGAYFPMSLAFSRLLPIPVVQTLHHQPHPSQLRLLELYLDAQYIAISLQQARALSQLRHVTVIPHGLDVQRFPFGAQPDDYLAFLGRFTPGKGALFAIDIARRAGKRLLMAAAENDYYRAHVAQHVDGDRIQYLGELDFATKTQFLSRARTLLYPVQEAEPFGLVLLEAMACGTPVAALRCGAAPELIAEGITGYTFNSAQQLQDGLPHVYALDRAAVRGYVQRHFDMATMVSAHEALYQRVVSTWLER